jgi:RNA polymerase sigma-70 factor, ECF subfamily
MAIDAHATPLAPHSTEAALAGDAIDPAEIRRLCDFYLPRIYGFVARRVDDRAVVEDLTARTLERAFAAVRSGDVRRDSVGRFIYRVAASAVVDHARRSRRPIPSNVRASDLDEGDDRRVAESISGEAATRAFAAAIDGEMLRRGLIRLADEHRPVIVLAYFDGLGSDELCAALGWSHETLAVELHRALRALRAVMTTEAADAA